jgi:hypothetical protein
LILEFLFQQDLWNRQLFFMASSLRRILADKSASRIGACLLLPEAWAALQCGKLSTATQ